MTKFIKGGIPEPSARMGISETGSEIIPNLDKKRNKSAFMNELDEIVDNSTELIGKI